MFSQTEPMHTAEHLAGSINVNFCNEQRTVLADEVLQAGHVVGKDGNGKVKEYNPGNSDGSENVAGIMFRECDATGADAQGVVTERCDGSFVVLAKNLTWFDGATDIQKAAGIAELEALGFVVR